MPALVDIENIVKNYGGTRALDGVSLSVQRGEILALLGHNGSGKSTLVKILDGVEASDGGIVNPHNTSVHVIHQNLGLIDSLTAIENLDIANTRKRNPLTPFSRPQELAKFRDLIEQFDVDIDPEIPVKDLTAAQRTIIAIVRTLDGLGDGDHLLVLDEPTATLHDDETKVLLQSVRSFAAAGVGIIYISHRLNEVMHLADRSVVLKDGRLVAEFHKGHYDQNDLLEIIAGATIEEDTTYTSHSTGEVILRVERLSGPGVIDADFHLKSGEILGIAGLIGSGMEHINSLIFGAVVPENGNVLLGDRQVPTGKPRLAIQAGIGYLPPDRLVRAGIRDHTAAENLTLPRLRPLRGWHGGISTAVENQEVQLWMQQVNALPHNSAKHLLHSFSGGNQQKILLAKWLRLKPEVLLLDEPTQGVDVGAQAEIRALLRQATLDGASFIVASSDTRELAELCDRVLVMHEGRIEQEIYKEQLTESALIRAILAGKSDIAESTPERSR